jgi:hypothetical protein
MVELQIVQGRAHNNHECALVLIIALMASFVNLTLSVNDIYKQSKGVESTIRPTPLRICAVAPCNPSSSADGV